MTKFLGILGIVLVAFGMLGGVSVNSFGNPLVLGHLILGVVCLIIWFVSGGIDTLGSATQIIQGRATRYGANATLSIVLFLAIVLAVNWISKRHIKRWDVTEQKVYSLSPQSSNLIGGLTLPLKLVYFKRSPQEDLGAQELLRRYQEINSGKVATEIVDPRTKPQLAEKYGMTTDNLVYIEYGTSDKPAVSRVNEATEEAITNAILKLTRGVAKKIYFVIGHDEPDLKSAKANGLAFLESALKDDHLTVETIFVGKVGSIPTDAASVILASPKKPLLPEEKKVLTEYAQNGGRLLLLYDPRTTSDIPEIAASFGITVNQDVILDQENRMFEGPTIGAAPIAYTYDSKSSITKNFGEQNFTLYNISASLSKAENADKVAEYVDLVKTGPTAWGETDLTALLDTDPPAAQKDSSDHSAPLTIAMSYSKKVATPDVKNSQPKEGEAKSEKFSRVVVFGDSDFALNANIRKSSNRDLILNSINWLAGEEGGFTIRAGTMRSSVQPVSFATMIMVLLSSFIVPELILICGLFVWWRRRMLSSPA